MASEINIGQSVDNLTEAAMSSQNIAAQAMEDRAAPDIGEVQNNSSLRNVRIPGASTPGNLALEKVAQRVDNIARRVFQGNKKLITSFKRTKKEIKSKGKQTSELQDLEKLLEVTNRSYMDAVDDYAISMKDQLEKAYISIQEKIGKLDANSESSPEAKEEAQELRNQLEQLDDLKSQLTRNIETRRKAVKPTLDNLGKSGFDIRSEELAAREQARKDALYSQTVQNFQNDDIQEANAASAAREKERAQKQAEVDAIFAKQEEARRKADADNQKAEQVRLEREAKVVQQFREQYAKEQLKRNRDAAYQEAVQAKQAFESSNRVPNNKNDYAQYKAEAERIYKETFAQGVTSRSTDSSMSDEDIIRAYRNQGNQFRPSNFGGSASTPGTPGGPASNLGGSGAGGGSGGGVPPGSPPPGGFPKPPPGPGMGSSFSSLMTEVFFATQNFQLAIALASKPLQDLGEIATKAGKAIVGGIVEASTGKRMGAAGSFQALGEAGKAAQGVAGGIIGAAGLAMFGPLGPVVGGLIGYQVGSMLGKGIPGFDEAGKMLSALDQIAANTSANVMPFSPELIVGSVDRQISLLETNIQLADKYGSGLADYNKTLFNLQMEMYHLGIEVFDFLRPSMTSLVKGITDIVTWIRAWIPEQQVIDEGRKEGGILGNMLKHVGESIINGLAGIEKNTRPKMKSGINQQVEDFFMGAVDQAPNTPLKRKKR